MFHTDKAILVEGKYDKIRLSALTDALILTTDGFGVFTDRENRAFIRAAAKEKGLIVLTDPDAAGFRIRNYVRNLVGDENVTNVFIPDVFGKEKRKAAPSKEGKLGVEGMSTEALEAALRRSGVFSEGVGNETAEPIAYYDLFAAGLSGGPESASRRRAFLQYLDLPARLTGRTLLQTLNAFYTREAFLEKLKEFNEELTIKD